MHEDEPLAPHPTAEDGTTTDAEEPAGQGGFHIPRETVSLDLEDYVLEWFQAQGDNYEDLMNQVLRDHIAAEEAAANQVEPEPDAE